MDDDGERWKTHARRHEKKLRKLQTAANGAIDRLGRMADELDQISEQIELALRGTDDRDN